jgi:hypothetical protein
MVCSCGGYDASDQVGPSVPLKKLARNALPGFVAAMLAPTINADSAHILTALQDERWRLLASSVCGETSVTKIKKGAGASPLRQLTPQNQNTVEVVFRPPREANIFICRSRMQVGCQPPGYPQFEFIRLKRWELAKGNCLGTLGDHLNPTKSHRWHGPALHSLGEEADARNHP